MKPESLQSTRDGFERFMSRFVSVPGVPDDLLQKVGHSRRVAALCGDFAGKLGWCLGDVIATQAMGWIHDAGRFVQFSRHGTFDDAASVDHGALGREIIVREKLLHGDDPEETEAILFAVAAHNRRALPQRQEGRPMRYLKLLRDADKIDIMATFGETIRRGDVSRYPQVFADRDGRGPADPDLVREVRGGQTGSYEHIGSLSDIVLVGVSWVRDINFAPALRHLDERGLLAGFEEILGGSPEALAVLSEVREEVRLRLAADAGRG